MARCYPKEMPYFEYWRALFVGPRQRPNDRCGIALFDLLIRAEILFLAGVVTLGCNTQAPVSQTGSEDGTSAVSPRADKRPTAPPANAPPQAAGLSAATESPTTDESLPRQDIKHICHVMEESGANRRSEAEHQFVVADWLGRTITSQPGRAFLATLSRTPEAGKAALLRATAERAGLEDCPLARVWEDRPG